MIMKNVSTPKLIGALIVIVIIAAAIIYFSHSGNSNMSPVTVTGTTSTTTLPSNVGASTSTAANLLNVPMVYSVRTAKKSYSQNEQFDIYVTVMNNTGEPQNFNFPNGCQGDFTIGDFDMVAHTRCLPDPTMFTVAPHDQASVKLTYYPSIYKIAPGNYTLQAEIIGYGGSSVPLTITK